MDISDSGNVDRYGDDFVRHCLPILKSFKYNKLIRKEIDVIHEKVFNKLGVVNKFQLKDKFEGEAYLRNVTYQFASLININRIINFTPNPLKLGIEEVVKSSVEFNGVKLKILNFIFGQDLLFKYDSTKEYDGFVIILHRDETSSYLCGFIYSDELISLSENLPYCHTSSRKGFKKFNEFKKLKPLESIL